MMAAALRWGMLALAFLLVGAPAYAFPLDLQVGDEIVQIEWDALKSEGDGGTWDSVTGIFHADGRLQAVNLTGASPSAPSIPQLNSTLRFDLVLVHQNLFVNGGTLQAFGNAFMQSAFNPAFELIYNGNSILTGLFVGNVIIEGNLDLLLPANVSQPLTIAGAINVTGGDARLMAAIGTNLLGPDADIFINGSVFNFFPSLLNMALTGNIFGQDFSVSMSGAITPRDPSPFVPEPSTALLLGFGLIGLLGASRRLRRNC